MTSEDIARLPCVSNILLAGSSRSAGVLIEKDDRVFVVPPGKLMHKKDFQIARVNEIRKGKKSGHWFQVQLYEGIKELPTNPNDLSPTELILRSKEYWLPSLAGAIIDNCGSYFRMFDDAIPDPPRMNSQIWFSRSLKTECVVCSEPYKAHKDRQRYCYTCHLWFHLQCLGDAVGDDFGDPSIDFHTRTTEETIDIEEEGEDGFPAIFNDVIQRPTVRGHGGEYNWDNNWLNTGSGVQKGLIARWQEQDSYPDDWLKLFGENFLQDFVIEKSWKFYACPRCERNI